MICDCGVFCPKQREYHRTLSAVDTDAVAAFLDAAERATRQAQMVQQAIRHMQGMAPAPARQAVN